MALAVAVAVVFFAAPKFRHEHQWRDATCVDSKVCEECGETEGEPLGHNWAPATELLPSRCYACGMVTGRSLGYQLTRCPVIEDSNAAGSDKDVCVGAWADSSGAVYPDALRFWVADFGNWNPEEYITYTLDNRFSQLELTIAPEENSEKNTRSRILVYSGEELLYESGWITDDGAAVTACVDITGCRELTVVCGTDSGDFHYCIVDGMLYN